MGQNNLQAGIFPGGGNAKRRQSERNAGTGVDHSWNTQLVRGREYQISILRQRVNGVADGMELHAHETQIFYASPNLALIRVVIAMRAHTREAEETARIFGAKLGDLVVVG